MFSPLPLSLALLLSIAPDVLAVPQTTASPGLSMSLSRRSPSAKTSEEWGVWAKSNKEMLGTKYGGGQPQKRSSGTNLMVNQNTDSSFYGSLAIGTPAVSYNVILDTGSADLWIADSNCKTGCGSVPTFDSTASSSFQNKSTVFSITYGSGGASGSLGSDTVQMAGFSVPEQVFGVCDTVSSGLLSDPVSGLLGLAFESIASSGASPLWETLVKNGAWDSPVMSFQLTRYLNDSRADTLEPGGTFTMGFVNSSLYTGDIDYNDIPSGSASYWLQSMTALTVQGTSISLPSDSTSYAAIDTGTTLIGGPSEYIAEIYAQIPGSAPATGNFDGYYTYPCDTDVAVTLAFGGKSWPISNADFQLTQLSTSTCLGAFFELTTGSSAPSWIVGDTFLKNVYSVFRFDPASVGFAQLSDYALSLNGANADVPTATIGSVVAVVSATGSAGSSRTSNGASPSAWHLPQASVIAMAMSVVASFFLL